MPPLVRCRWAASDLRMARYHDEEWGVPVRESRALWEALVLDGFQAGLSWSVILRKRDAFRRAFANFDPVRVARFTERDVTRLLADEGIVRSRAKIVATVGNAKAFLAMQASGNDFSTFVWARTGGATLRGTGTVPTKTPLSEALSKDLKKLGFKFVGAVTVYAWMQAVGMVEDHEAACFRSSLRSAPR